MVRGADTRLVLIDGLPGSGKSTTAQFLCLHMERHGRPARWYFEEETPHPVFEFERVRHILNSGQASTDVFDQALRHWDELASAPAGGSTLILEASFFQTPLHPMLMLDWDRERIAAYVSAVERAIATLNPVLVVLRDADVVTRLESTIAARGAWFVELLEARLARSPYGTRRGLRGITGARAYFEEYVELVDQLTAGLAIQTVVVPVDDSRRHIQMEAIAAALGLPSFEPFETRVPEPRAFVGTYRRADPPEVHHVETDGTHLYLGPDPKTRLLHLGESRFEIAGFPVRLEFQNDGTGGIQSARCHGGLPDLPCDWVKA
jgi:hypothetical protein